MNRGWLVLTLLLSSFSAVAVDTATSAPTKILYLGDSLTEGYGVTKAQSFPTLVTARLNQKFVEAKSPKRVEALYGGIAGSTSASGLSRLKWFLKAKPQVLFLALGINDGMRGVPVTTIEKNLDSTLALAHEQGMKIVLGGMKLPPNFGRKEAAEFEAIYSKLSKKYSTALIPFILEGVAAEKALNIEDGIHPNAKGHEKIANLITPYLEKVL